MRLIDILTRIVNKLVGIVPVVTDTYAKIGDLLICFGSGVITPSAASTSTTKQVQFGRAFSKAPIVVIGLGGGPQIATLILTARNITASSFDAYIYASNTTGRDYHYIAVGKA